MSFYAPVRKKINRNSWGGDPFVGSCYRNTHSFFWDKVVTQFPEVSHLLPLAYLVVDVVR